FAHRSRDVRAVWAPPGALCSSVTVNPALTRNSTMSRTGHEQVVATGSVSVAGRRRVKNDRSMVPPSSRATSGPCGACGGRGPPRRHESDTDYLAACPWDSAFGPDLEFFLRR